MGQIIAVLVLFILYVVYQAIVNKRAERRIKKLEKEVYHLDALQDIFSTDLQRLRTRIRTDKKADDQGDKNA